jgi:hypothetical protein
VRINRKSIAAGLTVGLLAGGAGGAIAATTSGPGTASPHVMMMSGAARGWDGPGSGWGGTTGWGGTDGWGGTNGGWEPATGGGRGSWGGHTNISGRGCGSLARAGRRAAQAYLGISASDLDSRLQSGKTLAAIASSQSKSVAGLENAIEAATTASVNADSALSASQKASIITNLRSFVDAVVTGTWDGAAGPWHGGPGGTVAGGSW